MGRASPRIIKSGWARWDRHNIPDTNSTPKIFRRGRKIPETPWGSPVPIGNGDENIKRFPDGDGGEAEKRGWG
ncbi:hypothetical protein Tco_1384765 [Tanacetum coccineum]